MKSSYPLLHRVPDGSGQAFPGQIRQFVNQASSLFILDIKTHE
jgi:hypothetical protein